MIVDYSRDGEEFDINTLKEKGFELHDNDFRKNYITNINTGETTDEYKNILSFVGFLVNGDNDIYSVFPKNFVVKDLETDSNKIFAAISKHLQKRPDLYLGNEYGKKFKSNYPFASFFGIYDYYIKYGLHFEDRKLIKPNIGGKVNWKETIRLSNKFISNNQVRIFPVYYEKNYYFSAFLTECMIFSINYTIDKFGFLIDLQKVHREFSTAYFFDEKEAIIDNLCVLRQQTFKDNLLELIDHLVNFFSELQEGGNYYLKHYAFSSIWEGMVMDYLRLYFKEVKDNKIVFGDKRKSEIEFSKPSFKPNLANRNHYFTPDYYHIENDTQLIFDAKYYTNIKGMDYKQIAYYIFLNEYRDDVSQPTKYNTTYSALILPGASRESKIHFAMDPQFNLTNKNLIISEEYLNIREVIDFYLSQ